LQALPQLSGRFVDLPPRQSFFRKRSVPKSGVIDNIGEIAGDNGYYRIHPNASRLTSLVEGRNPGKLFGFKR
jgi:hypothetical protein